MALQSLWGLKVWILEEPIKTGKHLELWRDVAKIEFPHPTEETKGWRKMNVQPNVKFKELAWYTNDFNGAQPKAVCIDTGMLALRRNAPEVFILPNLYITNWNTSIHLRLTFK